MLSLVDRSAQNTGNVRVDLDVLDSMRRSWLIPKDTGKLVFPKQQNAKIANENVSQLRSKSDNVNQS